MKYYIADLHFFHSAMNERMDHRGFQNVEDMFFFSFYGIPPVCFLHWLWQLLWQKKKRV